MGWEFARNKVFDMAKDKVMKQSQGLYPAPLKILECVKTGLVKGPAVGYALEAKVC